MNIRSMRKLVSALAIAALLTPAVPAEAQETSARLIKGPHLNAVYYLGTDGKRYVFPNEKTYKTWYADFNTVRVVSESELAGKPIGGNVTYRPGVKLVKVQTDPRVYAVAAGGAVRHITSEAVAAQMYGSAWAMSVDDVPDAFFVNYRIGAPIAAAGEYDRATTISAAASINVDKGLGPEPAPLTGSSPFISLGCGAFPPDNPWNTDISAYPVHANSDAYITSIGSAGLHPDFGETPTYGIPFEIVDGSQPKVPITFTAYGDESDPGPYPIPPDARVEAGSDAHVLVVDAENCMLYELFGAEKTGAGWNAASGAVFNLKSNALRPEGWTSADAAGLPIFPGLVRYDEVKSGAITHALRFTASPTQQAYIHPATHWASSGTNPAYPPMGLRVRLKQSYDISGFTGDARVILEAMKKYGMFLADNGGDWFFQGEMGAAWDDDDLNTLKSVPGSAFEAVDTGPLVKA